MSIPKGYIEFETPVGMAIVRADKISCVTEDRSKGKGDTIVLSNIYVDGDKESFNSIEPYTAIVSKIIRIT